MVATIRSFFAVPLSVTAEQQLAGVTGSLQQRLGPSSNPQAYIRWIPPRNYHLTLAFLGDIQSRDLQLLDEVAQQVASQLSPDIFYLTQIEWFPSALKPRLLVAVPSPCETLVRLYKQLNRLLHQRGFHIEKREFRPHITLARLKDYTQPLDLSSEVLTIPCELDELVLFSSSRDRDGSVYSPLLVEPIGPSP